METMPYTLPEFKLSEPDQALTDFCCRYPEAEAQQLLWKWFSLALKDSQPTCMFNTELISFYEDLKTLFSALYQLHDLSGQIRSEPPSLSNALSTPANPSLADALESQHTHV